MLFNYNQFIFHITQLMIYTKNPNILEVIIFNQLFYHKNKPVQLFLMSTTQILLKEALIILIIISMALHSPFIFPYQDLTRF